MNTTSENKRNRLWQLGLAIATVGLLLLFGQRVRANTGSVTLVEPATAVATADRLTSYQPIVRNDYPAALDNLPNTPQSCRYAVSNLGPNANIWNAVLRAGMFIDFGTNNNSSATATYVPIIRLESDGANGYVIRSPGGGLPMIRTRVLANPGSLWIVGNEPDTFAQDGLTAEVYARGYHDVYHTIKRADPTARVANAALVSGTPNRIEYMEQIYQAYQRLYGTPWPVDVWTMHSYILPEMGPNGEPHQFWKPAIGTSGANGMRESTFRPQDCQNPNDNRYCYAEHDSVEIVESHIRNIRNWMASKGQQDKALMLTEWSVLYPYEIDPDGCYLQDEFGNCYTPQRVRTFMNDSINMFESLTDPAIGNPHDGNRLVQNWFWFSTYTTREGSASNLLQGGAATATDGFEQYLTIKGQAFITRATQQPLRPNLYVANVFAAASASDTVRLTALIVNNGNVPPSRSFKVTFYADAALTNAVAEQAVTVPIDGCALERYYVTADWQAPAGMRYYYVQVDSANEIVESNETDNGGRAIAFSQAAYTVHIPVVRR